MDAKGIFYNHIDVFKFHGVSKSFGWAILREPRHENARKFHNKPDRHRETRGRKKIFSEADIDRLERFIAKNGCDSRQIPWTGLPAAAGLDIDYSEQTVRRALNSRKFRFCIACKKSYVSPDYAARRKAYAELMLERYPRLEDWRHVRFSDKIHFGFGPQSKVYVLRRSWERNCPDCVVEENEPKNKDLKRLHYWAAVGYDFKNPLI